jgi:hypothetical protein
MTHDAQSASGKVKRVAGHTLHRMTLATVQRLWERLQETHTIAGSLGPDGQEIAVAVPHFTDTKAKTGWVGYSMDGTTWWGAHVTKGPTATRLLAAVVREVTSDE